MGTVEIDPAIIRSAVDGVVVTVGLARDLDLCRHRLGRRLPEHEVAALRVIEGTPQAKLEIEFVIRLVELGATGERASPLGSKLVDPLEAELNMPKESYSLGVRYKVAKAAAEISFDSVGTNVADAVGYTVPKRQLEQLAARASVDFDEFYAQRPRGAGEDDDGVLVLTTDGKGVAMRREDLRNRRGRRPRSARRS